MMKAGCSGRRWTCLPVYIASPVSLLMHDLLGKPVVTFPDHALCGQQEYLADLRRSLDLARIARHPGRAHRLLGDRIEMLGADAHVPQAAGHAEPADEGIEDVAGILAGL